MVEVCYCPKLSQNHFLTENCSSYNGKLYLMSPAQKYMVLFLVTIKCFGFLTWLQTAAIADLEEHSIFKKHFCCLQKTTEQTWSSVPMGLNNAGRLQVYEIIHVLEEYLRKMGFHFCGANCMRLMVWWEVCWNLQEYAWQCPGNLGDVSQHLHWEY